MARTKFRVEVLTPEGQAFDEEVEMVSTRTGTGSIGVLANHAPLMAILDPTELRLFRSDSDVESRLREARDGLEQAEEGSEELRLYERRVSRYEAFLEVAQGS